MSLMLEIPEEAVMALGLCRSDAERELKKELAILLYARGALSLGKAVEMAGLPRPVFESALAQWRIIRPFDFAELQSDLDWAHRS